MSADLEKLLAEYRTSMDADVLHSWAADMLTASRALTSENAALRAKAEKLAEALRSVDEMFSRPGTINKTAVRDQARAALTEWGTP